MPARPMPARARAATRRLRRATAATIATALAAAGCSATPALPAKTDRVRVIVTMGLLRDLVANVGGSRVEVAAIVPDGTDPHSYEPTLRSARNVVYADVAFSNYALLEEHSVIKTLDANLRPDAPNVSLAEESIKYAAELIPLVENANLDTLWLGLRAHGHGAAHGADRRSQVELSATAVTGPGDVFAYLTGTFGDTEVYIDSSDGFDTTTGFRDDTATLPPGAHTHLSWAFTQPGIHTLTMRSRLRVDDTTAPVPLGSATVTFAVGVDARTVRPGALVLDRGHADLTVNLDTGALEVRYDPEGGGEHTQQVLAAKDVVIDVPAKALDEIPGAPQFRFLGKPGTPIYQLPQAVLGKHVHGEIDPHLWQDVRNTMAYVQLIRDTLIAVDPAGAHEYRANTDAYLTDLEAADAYLRRRVAQIPEHHRHLVTTHDAFAYLARAYGLHVAGFLTPNPAVEPSLADRRKLAQSLRTLDVPAVFLETGLAARSSALAQVAADEGVRVCPLWGDTFDGEVTTYLELVHANADSLHECLAP